MPAAWVLLAEDRVRECKAGAAAEVGDMGIFAADFEPEPQAHTEEDAKITGRDR